jgi:hypothetical protein
MIPKKQKGVAVSASRRTARRVTAVVNGNRTPDVLAEVTNAVGGSANKTAGKRSRVGQRQKARTSLSRRRNSGNCSAEAMDCPASSEPKYQLRSTPRVGIVVEADSSDEVSDCNQNCVLSPQGRERVRVGVSKRTGHNSNDCKHTKINHSRLESHRMSAVGSETASADEEEREKRGASLNANTSSVCHG